MDEQNLNYPFPAYEPDTRRKFSRASMILGFCALFSIFTFFLPLPLGALGLLFYFLSTRNKKTPDGAGKAGLITSSIALGIGVLVISITMAYAAWLMQPANRELLNTQFHELYGVSFEEYMESVYGENPLD